MLGIWTVESNLEPPHDPRGAAGDHHIAFDVGVVADVAVSADHGPGHHVRERPDARAGTDRVALDERAIVDEVVAARRGGGGHPSMIVSIAHWVRRRAS